MRRNSVLGVRVLSIVSLVLACASARAQVHENWLRTYNSGSGSNDVATAVAVAPSGNVYVGGVSSGNAATVLKYAPDGELRWVRTATSPAGAELVFGLTVQPSDESVFAFGRAAPNVPMSTNSGLVLKYDAAGSLLWSAVFLAPPVTTGFNSVDFYYGRLTASGDLIVAGTGSVGLCVVRYDPQGNVIWSQRVPDIEYLNDLEIDPFGDVVIAATSSDESSPPNQFEIVKVSRTGAFLWTTVVSAGGTGLTAAYGLTTDASGAIYAVGGLNDPVTGRNGALVTLDPSGNVSWIRLDHGTAPSVPSYPNTLHNVAVAPNGNIQLAGAITNAGTALDVHALEYTPDGQLVWQAWWSGLGSSEEFVKGVISRPDGALTVLGATQDATGKYNPVTIEWDAQGVLRFASIDPVSSTVPSYLPDTAFGSDGTIVFGGATTSAVQHMVIAREREQELAFCFGDGSNGPCPCGNQALPGQGNGCVNSSGASSRLTSNGSASLASDTLVLTSSGEIIDAASVFLQATTTTSPAHFGDGLLCIGQTLKRLYVHSAQSGIVSAPQSGEASISTQSAAHGDAIGSGATRFYQVYYRDSSASFCPGGANWNVSSGIAVTWY
jgi:hypothetical protein